MGLFCSVIHGALILTHCMRTHAQSREYATLDIVGRMSKICGYIWPSQWSIYSRPLRARKRQPPGALQYFSMKNQFLLQQHCNTRSNRTNHEWSMTVSQSSWLSKVPRPHSIVPVWIFNGHSESSTFSTGWVSHHKQVDRARLTFLFSGEWVGLLLLRSLANKYFELRKLVGLPSQLELLAIVIRKSGHDSMSNQCTTCQSMSTHSFTQAWAHRHTVR